MGELLLAGKVPQLVVPSSGLMLADIAEGSIVKLNENGSPVEFYVACHNYESALNGVGRTLLVRKDCCNTMKPGAAEYDGSDLDAWCTDTYKALLDAEVQELMGNTTIEVYEATLLRSAFTLSMTELGFGDAWTAEDNGFRTGGSELPIASVLKIAYLNGTAKSQFSRCTMAGGMYVCYVTSGGEPSYDFASSVTAGTRPAFTLPSTALFNKTTLEFKGA